MNIVKRAVKSWPVLSVLSALSVVMAVVLVASGCGNPAGDDKKPMTDAEITAALIGEWRMTNNEICEEGIGCETSVYFDEHIINILSLTSSGDTRDFRLHNYEKFWIEEEYEYEYGESPKWHIQDGKMYGIGVNVADFTVPIIDGNTLTLTTAAKYCDYDLDICHAFTIVSTLTRINYADFKASLNIKVPTLNPALIGTDWMFQNADGEPSDKRLSLRQNYKTGTGDWHGEWSGNNYCPTRTNGSWFIADGNLFLMSYYVRNENDDFVIVELTYTHDPLRNTLTLRRVNPDGTLGPEDVWMPEDSVEYPMASLGKSTSRAVHPFARFRSGVTPSSPLR